MIYQANKNNGVARNNEVKVTTLTKCEMKKINPSGKGKSLCRN